MQKLVQYQPWVHFIEDINVKVKNRWSMATKILPFLSVLLWAQVGPKAKNPTLPVRIS